MSTETHCGLPPLVRDFIAVRDELGPADLTFPLDEGDVTVKAWGRNLGARLVPSGEASIRRYSDERADIAKAYYVKAEAKHADGSPHVPERGDSALLFGRKWQVRATISVGASEGELMILTLADEEGRGGRSGGI